MAGCASEWRAVAWIAAVNGVCPTGEAAMQKKRKVRKVGRACAARVLAACLLGGGVGYVPARPE